MDELALGGAGADHYCAGVDVPSERLPVDLFVVVDRSSSMRDATASGVSKLAATKAALRDLLMSAPPNMGVGLSFFPSATRAGSCSVDDHVDAALMIEDVNAMRHDALSLLDDIEADGSTPTGPALGAAYEIAGAHGQAHPDRSVVVVLATDGKPTACAPTDAASLATLARGALAGPGRVRTMVVTLATERMETDNDLIALRAIAIAGGTQHPYVISPRSSFATQLSEALRETAARRIACDLALPEPPNNQRLDYDRVNVVLDGDERQVLRRVESSAACGKNGGWYYDVDPAVAAPSRLDICPASCEQLGSDTGQLKVELGCKTRLR
jgi:hypothetical protein